ncbi:MAG: hypothetical protein IPP96_17070 [Chitinophagaceae bacterium]|nr:hypothetical protein [Chitinophagaceae bacterium]
MNSIFDYLRTLKFDDDIKLISLLIGVIGIFFALRNQYLTRVTHAERSTFEMIDKLYNLCHTIEKTLLDDWRLSHMFCMGKDEYLKRRFDIEKSMESDSEKTKYKYKEFHYTIHLLLIYEQV